MTGTPNILETLCESEQDFLRLALKYGSPIKSRENGDIIDTKPVTSKDWPE